MEKQKGFTLIEVILSLAIIGIVSIAILTGLNTSLQNIVRAGNRTEAVEISEKVIFNETDTVEKQYTVTITIGSESLTVENMTINEIKGSAVIDGSSGDSVEIITHRR